MITTDTGFWEHKISFRGHPYAVWNPPMPKQDDLFIKSVVYIYSSEKAARNGELDGGTGFLLSVPLEKNPDRAVIYAVTNVHVINDMKEIVIRINTKDGKFDVIKTTQKQWIRHKKGDDVAIAAITMDGDYHDYGSIGADSLITKEFIDKFGVGGGDEVYMVGRFINREGKQKNLPAVRKGIVASIDTEAIRHDTLGIDQESFLVEIHSISGYSGSPVLLIIEPFHERHKEIDFDDASHVFALHSRLLGVDWGHLPKKELVHDKLHNPTDFYVKVNAAMMLVVPAWKIQDILDLPEQVKLRKEVDEKVTKRKAESPAISD